MMTTGQWCDHAPGPGPSLHPVSSLPRPLATFSLACSGCDSVSCLNTHPLIDMLNCFRVLLKKSRHFWHLRMMQTMGSEPPLFLSKVLIMDEMTFMLQYAEVYCNIVIVLHSSH